MAQQRPAIAPETQPYTVLRAICMAGARVEVDSVVHLTRQQAQELSAAGKVSAEPVDDIATDPPPKARPRAPGRNVAG